MIVALLVLFSAIYCSYCANEDNPIQYDESYSLGVKAYYDYDWTNSVQLMKRSVSDYKETVNVREVCFERCQHLKTNSLPDYADDQELHFFHILNEHTICRETCKQKHSSQPLLREVNYEMEQSLTLGDVHNYIQMSLFKEDKVKEAARHAATNCYLNPQNPSVQSNIEYYQGLENVTDNDLVSLDSKQYRDLYIEGQQLYNKDEFEVMIEKFELSLKQFYMELKKCRVLCEGPLQFTDGKVLADAISSLYLSVLECKQSCPDTLGRFRRDDDSNFFGSYFHYIQYGYYQTDRFQEAVKTLTTHRRIEPKNEVARMNGAYFQRLPGVSKKDFVEREDTKPILDMLEEERELLEIVKHLITDDNEEEIETHETMDDSKLLEEDFAMYPIIPEEHNDTSNETDANKFIIVETPADHNGVERIVVDGILTEQQCKDLLELTEACVEGDGYGTKSPHTQKEMFEGLTAINAAKAAVKREANHTHVEMYLNSCKTVLDIVHKQFDLQQQLYFSFTHLVCRTAKDGLQDDRNDFSHPVHADNCILDAKAGECLKESPAFTWRDYSAILYLNSDFEGGDFFFAHSPKDPTPQHHVKPKCGRMVGFSAGKENLHGVHAITKGKRCAVALWFTLDPKHTETSFHDAETLLHGIQKL